MGQIVAVVDVDVVNLGVDIDSMRLDERGQLLRVGSLTPSGNERRI